MPAVEVVKAQYTNEQHAKDLVTVLNAYACDPMGGGEPLAEHVQRDLAANLAKRADAFTFLCYVDGQPAGLANCFEGFSTFKNKPLINIHDIAVLPNFRGLGISQGLLAAVEKEAHVRGCCKITLEVLAKNEIAKNAYRKFGFANYELDPLLGPAMFWEKAL